MSQFLIEADGLGVSEGTFEILRQVSFRLPVGGFLSIIGPNGSGKTTLIRVLLGLHKHTRGSVTLFGQPPLQVDSKKIGYVPQIKTLDRSFPALSLELVYTGLRAAWPWKVSGEDEVVCMAALERAGAKTLARKEIRHLSGGELQRVYLARALVRRPKVVILDEPATGIDPQGEDDLYHLLAEYQREDQGTVVMVTHDLDVASHHSSHVLLLKNRQIGFGPPAQCLSTERLMEMFGHQGHKHAMLGGAHES